LTSLNNNDQIFIELSDNKKQLEEAKQKLESIKLSIDMLQLQIEDNLKLEQEIKEFVKNFDAVRT